MLLPCAKASEYPRLPSENTNILPSSIVIIHELAYSLKFPHTSVSTPNSTLFREYRSGQQMTYDGGSFIEHLLMKGELHVNVNRNKIFVVTSSGAIRAVTEEIIDIVVDSENTHLLRVILSDQDHNWKPVGDVAYAQSPTPGTLGPRACVKSIQTKKEAEELEMVTNWC